MSTLAFTAHAATVIAERGIQFEWVARALNSPAKIKPHATDTDLLHVFAPIAEWGNRILHVVYNRSVDPPRVVTAYFYRAMRGRL